MKIFLSVTLQVIFTTTKKSCCLDVTFVVRVRAKRRSCCFSTLRDVAACPRGGPSGFSAPVSGMLVPTEVSPPKHHKPLVQARRAQIQHHRELKEREYVTQNEENRHLRDDIRDLQKIIALLKDEKKRLQQELLERVKDNDWLKKLLEEQTLKCKGYDEERLALQTQLNAATAQHSALEASIKESQATIVELKDRIAALLSTEQNLRDQLKDLKELKARFETLTEANETLLSKMTLLEGQAAESEAHKAAAAQAQTHVATLQSKCVSLRQKISSMKQSTAECWSGSDDSDGAPKRSKPPPGAELLAKHAAELQTLHGHIAALTTKHTETLQRVERAENHSVTLQNNLSSLQIETDEKLAAANAEKSRLQREIADAQAHIRQLTTELAQSMNAMDAAKAQATQLNKSLDEARSMNVELSHHLDVANNELEHLKDVSARCDELSEMIHVFRQQRRVAGEYVDRSDQNYAEKLAASESRVQSLTEERDDAVALAGEKSKLLVASRAEASALQQKLETKEHELDQVKQSTAALTKQVEDLQSQLHAAHALKTDADLQHSYVVQENQSLHRASQLARDDIARLQHDLDSRHADLLDAHNALSEAQQQHADLAQRTAAHIDDLNARHAVLQNVLDSTPLCRDPNHQKLSDQVVQLQHELVESERTAALQTAKARDVACESLQQKHVEEINRIKRDAETKQAQSKKNETDAAARLEHERAEWTAKLRLSESRRQELESSLEAKVVLVKQHQAAIVAAEKACQDRVSKALESQHQNELQLRSELAHQQEQLNAERSGRSEAERNAAAARAELIELKKQIDAMRETQLHW